MNNTFAKDILKVIVSEFEYVFLVDLEKDNIDILFHNARECTEEEKAELGYPQIFSESNIPFKDKHIVSENVYENIDITNIDAIRSRLLLEDSLSLSYMLDDGRSKHIEVKVFSRNDGMPKELLLLVPEIEFSKIHTQLQNMELRKYQEEIEGYINSLELDLAREKRYKDAISANAISTYQVDVTEGIIVGGTFTNYDVFYPVEGVELPGPMEVHTKSWSERIKTPNVEEFLHLMSRDNLIQLYERDECSPYIEYLIHDIYGNKIYLRQTINLMMDEKTGHLQAFIVLEDITERINSAIESKFRKEVIDGLIREFSAVFLVYPETDAYEIFRTESYVYNTFRDCFKDSYSRSIYEFIEQGVYERDKEMLLNALSTEEMCRILTVKNDYKIPFRVKGPDEVHYCIARVTGIGAEKQRLGKISTVIVTFANMQEEWEKDQQQKMILEGALAQAKNAESAKNQFLSRMSHDIRTPMNAIMGFTSIASTNLDDKELVRNSLDNIQVSSEHLLRLINDILDMSKIESGKMNLNFSHVNLQSLITEIVGIVKTQADKKNVVLNVSVEENLPENIICDKSKIIQLVVNILENAVKYSYDKGEVSFKVRKYATYRNRVLPLEIIVEDHGIGMSEEFQKKVFEPFEREQNVELQQMPGTGLGLAISRQLIELMNGGVSFRSAPGQGTIFVVQIPLEVAAEKNADQKGAAERKLHRVQVFKTERTLREQEFVSGTIFRPEEYRLLLVEDNLINREIETFMLTEAGYRVESAVNGSDAVEQLRRKGISYYDAVLMDVQMPVMNGFDATMEIRNIEMQEGIHEQDHIPVIAMTAEVYENDIEKAQMTGMDAYITKPIDRELMLSILETVLMNH